MGLRSLQKSASFRFSKRSPKKMDRLRRSFRDSFRRRKDRVPESSKPHQWQSDEQAVRSATCSFPVKYLGCVEVFESRGMQVCEEALKVLRVSFIHMNYIVPLKLMLFLPLHSPLHWQNSRRRAIRGILHVSGDGLRVVDDDTKGLIVDQTIEKVSFCAPDRNHERGFSYICRDGTTRRWMCHGFLASKDSGERLSHAVGCAFAVCLERKQRRDTECSVTMTFDMKNSTFTRSGSFRQPSLTERLANERGVDVIPSAVVPPLPKPHNPFAIERPHATPSMLERQGSFRGFTGLNNSPFKRQMSLRLNDLPSNAERQKSFLEPLSNGQIRNVSPIPEVVPVQSQTETVSSLCQQLSQGLSLLTRTDLNDDLNFNTISTVNKNTTSDYVLPSAVKAPPLAVTSPAVSPASTGIGTDVKTAAIVKPNSSTTTISSTALARTTTMTTTTTSLNNDYISMLPSTGSISIATVAPTPIGHIAARHRASVSGPVSSGITTSPLATSPTSPEKIVPVVSSNQLPNADQWLGQVVKSTSPAPRRAPALGMHARARSLSSANDPFDSEWASVVTRTENHQSPTHSTNPFIQPKPPVQSFQVQLWIWERNSRMHTQIVKRDKQNINKFINNNRCWLPHGSFSI